MNKVLIANRGEIAVRIARACADLGLRSVAVYADVDHDALHTRIADEAHALEGNTPAETYLNVDKLLAIARRSGAQAVHPGYGFLSENAAFARAVIDAGLIWIGPPPDAMAALGDKVRARAIARAVGAPLVAGTSDPVGGVADVLAFARTHGLPVAIKAAHGGGGRGLKVVRELAEIEAAYASAVREARLAFGAQDCYVERYLDRPRHIEAQVMADAQGHVVVLGTRDCSLQRRHQKLVEEGPAPFLSAADAARIHDAVQAICREVAYVGAGTVEFLLAEDGTLTFLEVNTRLQVEHPVTELTTGLDLVVEQLRVADGQSLSMRAAPAPQGHAIELRINAEDVARGFLPAPGRVLRFEPPAGPGVRVDAGVVSGSVVAPQFDSLMAKLIVHGATREQALARARRAVAECCIEGVPTTLDFHRAVLLAPEFKADTAAGFSVHTRWVEEVFAPRLTASLGASPRPEEPELSPLSRMAIEVDGRRVSLGLPARLLQALGQASAPDVAAITGASAGEAVSEGITAPAAGVLRRWLLPEGAQVTAGMPVAVLEAMKMELELVANHDGRLNQVVPADAAVTAGAVVARVQLA